MAELRRTAFNFESGRRPTVDDFAHVFNEVFDRTGSKAVDELTWNTETGHIRVVVLS